ncbi:hypothetical protein PHLGIDRAFT_152085 [Phlebiopsis gigantea 11061_1 CR5-6]|uniref:Xylanolytic transcriptional activator regulatory domain-containing protein n=1 Tax=Phlebiopsis gigantea (strain 11061_1 CR5-6) TaxID=745531 RepID=A0A0C3S8K2_PHLG1|nr:hypothetical protein PHLGIDRAFT_152085 [Phlebiopsis gigantea 11061_1 CR5-6]
MHTHYVGRSSSLAVVRTAMALKEEYTQSAAPEHYSAPCLSPSEGQLPLRALGHWEETMSMIPSESPHPPEAFPDPALVAELVDAYFTHLNVYFPLLHRPTFEAGIRDGLHFRHEGFGSTALLVCAIGARFSDDVRVLPSETKSWHWAGWVWFQRVSSVRKLVHLTSPSVYDLQICILITWYMAVSPIPHTSFAIVGHGMRVAQDMGAHRRTTYGPRLTVEEELKKRAFWLLVCIERGMCDRLGRPYSLNDEDFDVDLPVECDDEYWTNDDPDLAFKQPPGIPSTMSMFFAVLRLGKIFINAYRTWSRIPTERFLADPDNALRLVSELDSELNGFLDSIPEHLKWDTQHSNPVFCNQSALLYASYYMVQITVHRSFVTLPRRPSLLPFPSLAICTNAARSCLRVLERQFGQVSSPPLFLHWQQMSLFMCSVLLLLNVWHAKLAGVAINIPKELEDVQKAMRILQSLESRWSTAARFWDILNDIVESMNRSLALSESASKDQHLRSQSPRAKHHGDSSFEASPFPTPQPRPSTSATGSAEKAFPTPTLTPSTSHQSGLAPTLPLRSHELGRLPVWSDESVGSPTTEYPHTNKWPRFGFTMASSRPKMPSTSPTDAGEEPSQRTADPELESLFTELIPDGVCGHPFGLMS